MRITLVSPFDPTAQGAARSRGHVGGVERVFAELSRNLAQRQHDVTLLCSTSGPSGSERMDGVEVVRVRRRFTAMRAPVVDLAGSLPEGADVVHVPATYPFTTSRVIRRARRRGTPTVLDYHFEPEPGRALGRAAAALYRHVGPRAYPLADAVVLRSHAYGRSARSLAKIPESRWRIVPNGIDTQRFRPDGPRREGAYILFVGRLVPYKGIDVLLRALARRRPGLPLLVAGEGPLGPDLRALAKHLAVDARFLGHVAEEDLPALYRGAQLTVLPSVTRQEAFGLVLLESMACGTPVVASALPGVGELAQQGGFAARPGDPDDLGAAIHRALQPGTLRRGPELAGRIRQQYSWEAVTDRFLEVYDEILAARPGARLEVETPARAGGRPVL